MDHINEDVAENDMIWNKLLEAIGTSQVPCDLMAQIVLKLPVKSIVRFKSVCKAWLSLFNDQAFVYHHTRLARSLAKTTNRLSLLVRSRNMNECKDDRPFSLLCDRPCGKTISIELSPPFDDVGFDNIQVVGTINGLVCLNIYHYDTLIILLWNPTTRKCSTIPNPSLMLQEDECFTLGFGYDREADSYKVARILILYPPVLFARGVARVEIYNTGTNTWKRIDDVCSFPQLSKRDRGGAVVDGAHYWYSREGISRFDASTESFGIYDHASIESFWIHDLGSSKNIELPWWFCQLVSAGEHLVLLNYIAQDWAPMKRIDIRKLTYDRDNDSFHVEELIMSTRSWLRFKSIVGITRKGEIIALDTQFKLVLCDEEGMKYLPGGSSSRDLNVYDYIESLVWPNGLA